MKENDGIKDAEMDALREPHISIRVLTKQEADAEERGIKMTKAIMPILTAAETVAYIYAHSNYMPKVMLVDAPIRLAGEAQLEADLKRHYEIVGEIIEEARVLLEDIIDNHDTWGQEQVDVFVAGWEQKYLR